MTLLSGQEYSDMTRLSASVVLNLYFVWRISNEHHIQLSIIFGTLAFLTKKRSREDKRRFKLARRDKSGLVGM